MPPKKKKSQVPAGPRRVSDIPPPAIEFVGRPLTREVQRKLSEGIFPVSVVIEPDRRIRIDELREVLEASHEGEVTGKTDRYIFYRGSRAAILSLKNVRIGNLDAIFRVWLDKRIYSQETDLRREFSWVETLADSIKTIKVDAVWRSFGPRGEGIHWAVLDTGIYENHEGFKRDKKSIVEPVKDFTGEGKTPANFHGTHVAGILGQIAPKVRIENYKVLGKEGGTTSTIVQAMYDIRRRNDESLMRSDKLEIQGINMSLGGYPDVESYAVGWSPECREAARLVNQGCLVVVAAGNSGYQQFATAQNGNVGIYPNIITGSILDPGVAEEVVTVGSTHARYPWRYGVSFFSSKGPTGDGRHKPDLVAPGEHIESFDDKGETREATGTSMATPHVSGVLALFLSQFDSFQDRAAETKALLLKTCSDLGRDHYFQGRGLVDAFRLFQAV